MIPFDFITEWRATAPWTQDVQVEQDLVTSLSDEGLRVSRAEFEANLEGKIAAPRFVDDIAPLLAPRCPWDRDDAIRYVRDELVARLGGEPWKGRAGDEDEAR